MSDNIDVKVSKLEETVQRHDKIVWVVISLALIFGLSGGIGLKVLINAKNKIEEIGRKQTILSREQRLIEDKINKSKQEVGLLAGHEKDLIKNMAEIKKEEIKSVVVETKQEIDKIVYHAVAKAEEELNAPVKQAEEKIKKSKESAANELTKTVSDLKEETKKQLRAYTNNLMEDITKEFTKNWPKIDQTKEIRIKKLIIENDNNSATIVLGSTTKGGHGIIQINDLNGEGKVLISANSYGGKISGKENLEFDPPAIDPSAIQKMIDQILNSDTTYR